MLYNKKRFAPRAKRVVDIAQSQVGYHEGQSGGYWNNKQKYSGVVPGLEWSDRQPWCATFVSWVAMRAGVSPFYPRTASCDVGMLWFKGRNQWSEYPAVGAQVFFGSSNDSTHTGIVADFDDVYVYTVEGNTNDGGSREGDGVYFKKRLRRDKWLIGYGYPKFVKPLNSADPKYNANF